jgi:hypothetical protein
MNIIQSSLGFLSCIRRKKKKEKKEEDLDLFLIFYGVMG